MMMENTHCYTKEELCPLYYSIVYFGSGYCYAVLAMVSLYFCYCSASGMIMFGKHLIAKGAVLSTDRYKVVIQSIEQSKHTKYLFVHLILLLGEVSRVFIQLTDPSAERGIVDPVICGVIFKIETLALFIVGLQLPLKWQSISSPHAVNKKAPTIILIASLSLILFTTLFDLSPVFFQRDLTAFSWYLYGGATITILSLGAIYAHSLTRKMKASIHLGNQQIEIQGKIKGANGGKNASTRREEKDKDNKTTTNRHASSLAEETDQMTAGLHKLYREVLRNISAGVVAIVVIFAAAIIQGSLSNGPQMLLHALFGVRVTEFALTLVYFWSWYPPKYKGPPKNQQGGKPAKIFYGEIKRRATVTESSKVSPQVVPA
jgi:hypothetical protein